MLALDGNPADELSEWLAVARQRAGTPQGEPDLAQFQPGPESLASVAQSAASVAELEPVAEQAEPELDLATEPGVRRRSHRLARAALTRRADLPGGSPNVSLRTLALRQSREDCSPAGIVQLTSLESCRVSILMTDRVSR